MYLLPLDRIAASERIAADAANAVLGRGGAGVMAGLVVFSTVGGLTGIILTGPRVYYAMARDGLLFKWFENIHPRFRTPHRALAVQAVWACVLVTTGSYRVLFSRVIFIEWIFFGMLALALMLLRRRTELKRDYSIPGYPYIPALFAIAAFAIAVNHVATDIASNGFNLSTAVLNDSLFGLLLVLAGLPVFYAWRFLHHRRDPQQRSTKP